MSWLTYYAKPKKRDGGRISQLAARTLRHRVCYRNQEACAARVKETDVHLQGRRCWHSDPAFLLVSEGTAAKETGGVSLAGFLCPRQGVHQERGTQTWDNDGHWPPRMLWAGRRSPHL